MIPVSKENSPYIYAMQRYDAPIVDDIISGTWESYGKADFDGKFVAYNLTELNEEPTFFTILSKRGVREIKPTSSKNISTLNLNAKIGVDASCGPYIISTNKGLDFSSEECPSNNLLIMSLINKSEESINEFKNTDNSENFVNIASPEFEQPYPTIYQYNSVEPYSVKQKTGKIETQSMGLAVPQPVLPGQQLNIQALLPRYSSIPPLTWTAQTGSLVPITGTMAVYTAVQTAGAKDNINVFVQGTQPNDIWRSPVYLQIVGSGLYLTTIDKDPTGKIIQFPFIKTKDGSDIYVRDSKFTFGTVIVGYPGDQIVWDSVVGVKTDLGDGTFTLASSGNGTPVHLAAYLLNHPDVKLVFDGNFYQLQ